MQKKIVNLTPAEIRQRIYRYCAYQERCHQEVKAKLFELGAARNDAEEIVSELITQGFLNEERFARSYAGGKFRIKGWGRLKIVRALELKGLTSNCIKAGLSEIEEDAYLKSLEHQIEKKRELVDNPDLFVRRDKIATYLIQKGFEPELVWKALKTQVED